MLVCGGAGGTELSRKAPKRQRGLGGEPVQESPLRSGSRGRREGIEGHRGASICWSRRVRVCQRSASGNAAVLIAGCGRLRVWESAMSWRMEGSTRSGDCWRRRGRRGRSVSAGADTGWGRRGGGGFACFCVGGGVGGEELGCGAPGRPCPSRVGPGPCGGGAGVDIKRLACNRRDGAARGCGARRAETAGLVGDGDMWHGSGKDSEGAGDCRLVRWRRAGCERGSRMLDWAGSPPLGGRSGSNNNTHIEYVIDFLCPLAIIAKEKANSRRTACARRDCNWSAAQASL